MPQKPAVVLIGPNSEWFDSKLSTTNLKSLTLIGWAFFCLSCQ